MSYRECILAIKSIFGSNESLQREFLSIILPQMIGQKTDTNDSRRIDIIQFLHLSVVGYHQNSNFQNGINQRNSNETIVSEKKNKNKNISVSIGKQTNNKQPNNQKQMNKYENNESDNENDYENEEEEYENEENENDNEMYEFETKAIANGNNNSNNNQRNKNEHYSTDRTLQQTMDGLISQEISDYDAR